MNLPRFLIYLVLLIASGAATGEEFTAKVIIVLDGDTVLVQRKNGLVKIRLAEIDAPEKAQLFGETSRFSLSDMVLGKQVKISSQAVDQYGRMVAHLELNGLEISAEQVRRGMAWEYSHYHGNHALIALQETARHAQRGLWALGNPTPPWEWRKLHPNQQPDAFQAEKIPFSIACGSKKYCSEMVNCAEAQHYLTQCGLKTLDGNGNGVPCENLCNPRLLSK